MSEEIIKPLVALNPRDWLRLLRWIFLQPEMLKQYKKENGAESLHRGSILVLNLMIWLPFLPLIIVSGFDIRPTEGDMANGFVLVSVLLGFIATTWMGGRSKGTIINKKEQTPVDKLFNVNIGFILGLNFAVVMMIGSGHWLGVPALIAMTLGFAVLSAVASAVASNLIYGGNIIIMPFGITTMVYALSYGSMMALALGIFFIVTFIAAFFVSTIGGPLMREFNKRSLTKKNRADILKIRFIFYLIAILILPLLYLILPPLVISTPGKLSMF